MEEKSVFRFGPVLKTIREAKTIIKPAELARRIGIAKSTVSKWDAGINPIREDDLAQYLRIIGATMEQFAKSLNQPMEFKRDITIPVISLDWAKFDDLWQLKDNLYHPPAALEFIGAPGVNDSRAFAVQVGHPIMPDFYFEKGDHLVITPKMKPRSREYGLVLIRPKEIIAIREVNELDNGYYRLRSKDGRNDTEENMKDIRIYMIDSVIKKQRRKGEGR